MENIDKERAKLIELDTFFKMLMFRNKMGAIDIYTNNDGSYDNEYIIDYINYFKIRKLWEKKLINDEDKIKLEYLYKQYAYIIRNITPFRVPINDKASYFEAVAQAQKDRDNLLIEMQNLGFMPFEFDLETILEDDMARSRDVK